MSITGNLRTLEFAELLQWLAQGQKTGALVLSNKSVQKRIYFQDGKIISSESDNPDEHLGTYLIREGLIDNATLARAVKLQESTQILLGKVLVTLGTISEDELNGILKRKTEESLYELFNWTEGDFRFVPDELPRLPMVPLEIDVTNVVLEGAKRFDEARRDSRQKTGDHEDEIEDVLSADVFQGIEVTESEEELSISDQEPMFDEQIEPLSMREDSLREESSSAEVCGYYSGSGKSAVRRVPLLAAAAVVALIAIGISAYFFMRGDPAAGIADRESLTTSAPQETTDDLAEVKDLFLPLEETGEGIEKPAETEPTVESPDPAPGDLEGEQMQARYEAELQALKRQLEQAKIAAAERDTAVDRVAELEQQVAQARDSSKPSQSPPERQAVYRVASLVDPLEYSTFSAGGDELPLLGTPRQTTEADQEAGADFAADMVEVAPSPLTISADVAPLPAAEPIQPEEITVTESQISSPVLLTRPKPRYPAAAMRLGKEAVISLRLLIDANGKVVDVERKGQEQGLGFDKAAINAALSTRWQPGTRDGEPVEMWTEMRIAFKP